MEEKAVMENDTGGHSVAPKYPPAPTVPHSREEQNYHSQDMDVSMEEIPAMSDSAPPVILKEATPAVPSHSSEPVTELYFGNQKAGLTLPSPE